MNQDTNKLFTEHKVTFPLTLSEAIRHLANQETNNTQEHGEEDKQICNKTLQQLSVRLRLIFNDFLKTLYRKATNIRLIEDKCKIIGMCMQHELSDTRLDRIIKKLQYIYCAVTMHYIQHKDSTISSNDVPQKWIRDKNNASLNLNYWGLEIEKITDDIPTIYEEEGTENEIISLELENLPISTVIELINDSEIVVTKIYDYVKENCISYQKMRSLLPNTDEYSGTDVYTHLYQIFHQHHITQKLSNNFEEYLWFYNEFMLLDSLYDQALGYMSNACLETNQANYSILVSMWDKTSKTETEVSPLEFEFFSYLLKSIPSRKKGEKNIANQLSHGKWDVLPAETRDKIAEYIGRMSRQPQRMARFLGFEDLESKEAAKLIKPQIYDICHQIRFPHRYNAYCELKALCFELIERQKIFDFEKLDDNIEKLSEIQKELQKARKETV